MVDGVLDSCVECPAFYSDVILSVITFVRRSVTCSVECVYTARGWRLSGATGTE